MALEIEDHQENLEVKTKKKKKKQSLTTEETDDGTLEVKNGDSEHVENGAEIQSPTEGKKKKKKKKKKESVGEEVEPTEEQEEVAEQDSVEAEDATPVEDGEEKKKKKKKKNKQSLSSESDAVQEEVTPAEESAEASDDMECEEEKPAVKKGKKRPAEDSHSVYIGNMSFNTDETQLTEFFTSNGHHPTSVVIISWQSGLSSGFGIVDFATKEDAESAIELDGGTLDGRAVRMNIYTGKLQKTSGGFQKGRSPGGGGSGGFDGEETDTLFAIGLSFNSSEDDLYEAFQGCESIDVFKDKETGRSKGMAKIKYSSVDEAKSALAEMNNQEIDGRTVKLRYFSQSGGGGGRGGRGGFRGGRGGRGGGGFRGGRGGDRGRGFGRGRGRGRGGGTPFKGTGQKITFDD